LHTLSCVLYFSQVAGNTRLGAHQQSSLRAQTGSRRMLRKLPKIVLILMVLMAIFSPFMQLDSWDRFPVATGDIELQIISVLFETGMFFVIAGILKLFPSLLCSSLQLPVMTFAALVRDMISPETDLFCFAVPLRI
jgi:hypothetical protein